MGGIQDLALDETEMAEKYQAIFDPSYSDW